MPLGSNKERLRDERRKRLEQPVLEQAQRVVPKPVEFIPVRSHCNNCTASPREHDNGSGCNRPEWTFRFVPRTQ